MPSPQDHYEAVAERLPLGRDPASVRRRIEAMEQLLERLSLCREPTASSGWTYLRHHPGRRTPIAAAMGSWLAWEAAILECRNGISPGWPAISGSTPRSARSLGSAPFDFFFKSNTRNLRIVKRWLDKHHPGRGRRGRGDRSPRRTT